MLFCKKPQITMDVEVLFHTEANLYGSHGEIIVSHVDLGIKHTPVRFVFKGMMTPPALRPAVLAYLFQQAENKGYIAFELVRYGAVIQDEKTEQTMQTLPNARQEYVKALSAGYLGNYVTWKEENGYQVTDSERANAERLEKQLERQRISEISAPEPLAEPEVKNEQPSTVTKITSASVMLEEMRKD
ncbi:MAG: hypothetical protein K5Q00_05640 [Gammaproteobacteria bacterium]|nr:hypothetical protein [Gammaproteobacteria bacterium]